MLEPKRVYTTMHKSYHPCHQSILEAYNSPCFPGPGVTPQRAPESGWWRVGSPGWWSPGWSGCWRGHCHTARGNPYKREMKWMLNDEWNKNKIRRINNFWNWVLEVSSKYIQRQCRVMVQLFLIFMIHISAAQHRSWFQLKLKLRGPSNVFYNWIRGYKACLV